MTRLQVIVLCLILTIAPCTALAQSFTIMSYNVENLFDTINDPITADDDFTPQGNRHWNSYRYWHKLQHIAEVIVNTGGWQQPALVGLIEIESDTCLRDLCYRSNLRQLHYQYVHHESPDVRGIDVALLYDPKQFTLISECAIPIDFGYLTRPTRDLLYAVGTLADTDTFHIIVCHTPSQLGGEEGMDKRNYVLNKINSIADSIIQKSPSAHIVLMGDFNTSPENVSAQIPLLHNLMLDAKLESQGTYVYQQLWSTLDQFMVSPNILSCTQAHIFAAPWLLSDNQPHRTYNYTRYDTDGYSDHLPIFLNLQLPCSHSGQ